MLDPNHFRRLLNNPETSVEEDLENLELLLEEYPYLQSARALQLKLFKQNNSELYNDALKMTAAHTTDRDVLFKFITSELFEEKNLKEEAVNSQPTSPEENLELEDKAAERAQEETIEHKPEATLSIEPTQETAQEPSLDSPLEEESEAALPVTESSSISLDPEGEESPASILELDKPISFSKQDSYSFSKWMQLTSQKPIHREVEKENKGLETDTVNQEEIKLSKEPILESNAEKAAKSTDKVIHLVDEFLKNNPRPVRSQSFLEPEEISEIPPQNQASQSLMTETLARVYLQQKNYSKAIQAYKILILKNPEKSGYFADKIRAIEKLTNKK